MPNEEVEFSHGATILRQGDAGGFFYVLLSGAVEVYKDDVQLTTMMFPGTIFGEMADILGKPRTCTVKAKGNVKLTKITSQPMEQLMREQPDVVAKIIKTLATRLERTTQLVSDHSKESPMWTVEGKKPKA
ncbi:MAG TPA: cyclic nucleotide-binding domain-containing protein [Opitutales bacterium]|nr:cyclic nucleotide-binding domain-containing protein [Opitutales bacterium]